MEPAPRLWVCVENGPVSDLPRKAVTRTAKLAALPMGFAGRTALGAARRLGGAPAESVLTEVQLRTAEQVFKTLGELKGGAMKFGQILSVLESALPEQLSAPYRAHLTKLQDSAPPMDVKIVHKVLAQQLGEDWRELLPTFDPAPAASASIGQVHRGVWHDGREVAVKVQYPGAKDALMSDIRQLTLLARTLGSLFPGIDAKGVAAELRDRAAEELDYGLEASAQEIFAEAYDGDERFSVPHVVHGTSMVLVTEWLESRGSLAGIIDSGTKKERDLYGELFARWIFTSPSRTGMLHADPHPGNFRVRKRQLGVLDFGAVARLPDGDIPDYLGRLLSLALQEEWAEAETLLRDYGFIKPGIKVKPDDLEAYLGPFLEPARSERFLFTRDFMRSQTERIQNRRNAGSKLLFRLNLPPHLMLVHRTWLGTVGVLCQLEADVAFLAILEEGLPGFSR